MLTRTLPKGLGGQIGGDRKADESCVLDRLRRAPNQPDRLSIDQKVRRFNRRAAGQRIGRQDEMIPGAKSLERNTVTPPNCPPISARLNGLRSGTTLRNSDRTRLTHSDTHRLDDVRLRASDLASVHWRLLA
jgi:hypothetical protein